MLPTRLAAGLVVLLAATVLAVPRGDSCTGVPIPLGSSIQAAINANPSGTSFCLEDGTYILEATLKPKSDDTFTGPATIEAGTLAYGWTGASGVTLASLAVHGGKVGIRTGSSWTLDQLDVSGASNTGVKVVGENVRLTDSHIHDNGTYGLGGTGSVDAVVSGNELDHNNTSCANAGSNAGGMKFVKTQGLQFLDNHVHDNNGTGIWFDIDNTGALVSGNRSENNLASCGGGEGIRFEISCSSTISNNTVAGNQGAGGIDVANSYGVTVSGNTLSNAGTFELRALADRNRNPGTYGPLCLGGPYRADDDRFTANIVTLTGTRWVGLQHVLAGESMTGDTFDANSYLGNQCLNNRWKWWDGHTMKTVNFAKWQGTYNQDFSGSCS